MYVNTSRNLVSQLGDLTCFLSAAQQSDIRNELDKQEVWLLLLNPKQKADTHLYLITSQVALFRTAIPIGALLIL